MAEKEKSSFPMLPVKHWWALRERFKGSIPGVVSPTYIATVLNMKEESARANVILPLRMLGLIDEEDRTNQDLAVAWRDDERYKEACQEMVQRVYPTELIEAVPNPASNRDAVERWFASYTGSGKAAVKRMAALYSVLVQADLSATPQRTSSASSTYKPKHTPIRHKKKVKEVSSPQDIDHAVELPGIAINLQIHISSDATPDQIDAIFESMAKHIYKK